ncbi:hypothetical protein NHX12_027755 [Muraenolepis orangiensis]|uniref:Uncharacterized protein n=1 Tax=Muraenolepis orangiensis TaxID=630683 RepID=A0A9Q0IQR4_9TELE|nr:hypothetical protein NHX12_027755 [Muraenolepis orangiensis]
MEKDFQSAPKRFWQTVRHLRRGKRESIQAVYREGEEQWGVVEKEQERSSGEWWRRSRRGAVGSGGEGEGEEQWGVVEKEKERSSGEWRRRSRRGAVGSGGEGAGEEQWGEVEKEQERSSGERWRRRGEEQWGVVEKEQERSSGERWRRSRRGAVGRGGEGEGEEQWGEVEKEQERQFGEKPTSHLETALNSFGEKQIVVLEQGTRNKLISAANECMRNN